MFLFFIVIQVIVSLLLITIILMQTGRGGGLVESFSGVESIFGAKTNTFLVRTTTVLATLFLLNCLGLTYLSVQRNKSLMEKQDILQQQETTVTDWTEEQARENQVVEEPMLMPGEAKKEDIQKEQEESNIQESEELEKLEEEIDNTESQDKE